MNCIFCKIINKEIPTYTIYEDETVLAFLDIHPDSLGHTLIIPKKHIKDFDEIDNDTLLHILAVAKTIKERMEQVLKIDGLTFVQNNGEVQEVKHFHLHLKPFYHQELQMSLEEVYQLLK